LKVSVSAESSDWSWGERLPRGRALWFGVLAAPLAWLLHLLASYGLAALTCATGWPFFTIAGLRGVQGLMALLTLAALAVILAAAWASFQHLRAWSPADPWHGTHLPQWMAYSGLLLSGMFFIAVLFTGIADIVVTQCR
jgi:hypothetical protein